MLVNKKCRDTRCTVYSASEWLNNVTRFLWQTAARWHRAKHLDSTTLSITLRPVVQCHHTFVTHITHNSILPLTFRVEGFWSSSPETSSSRLLLRSPYTLIRDVPTHAILLWTLLKTRTVGQHRLHAIASSINANFLVKRKPFRKSNAGSKHQLTQTETMFINNKQ